MWAICWCLFIFVMYHKTNIIVIYFFVRLLFWDFAHLFICSVMT